jgi:hypothetical protein
MKTFPPLEATMIRVANGDYNLYDALAGDPILLGSVQRDRVPEAIRSHRQTVHACVYAIVLDRAFSATNTDAAYEALKIVQTALACARDGVPYIHPKHGDMRLEEVKYVFVDPVVQQREELKCRVSPSLTR